MSSCCAPGAEPGRPTDAAPALGAVAAGTDDVPALVDIPGGTFTMGTDELIGYPADGEGPAHPVTVDPFRIARAPVTNAQFAAFAEATGYRTQAEVEGSSFVFGGLLPDDFPDTQGVVAAPWWRLVIGSSWRHPEGPQSSIDDRPDHPVVHVSWIDARAYCAWTGTRLPTEAEWERAARGGLEQHHFPWGDDLEPDGEHRMNVFQGEFPGVNTAADGWAGTSPVGSYAPNGFGLVDVTGNVWEWCADWFDPRWYRTGESDRPSGPPDGDQRVTRGGSYLCHASYCNRYRVDARSSNTPDSSTGNTGFRCAADIG